MAEVWRVLYVLVDFNGNAEVLSQTFAFNPTKEDINEVGLDLIAEHNCHHFIPCEPEKI